jgi:cold shock CspA family protein
MLKAMLFVDADWLCASTLDLGGPQGKPDLQIDHRRLGGVLADEIGRRHHLGPIDVVRSHYFASRAYDRDARDQSLSQRRRAFLAGVQGEPRLELELVDLTYSDRPVNRDAGEALGEASALHVALTVAAMRHALTPGVLDLAIFLLGDRSFAPLLQELRRLGRRVALVSVDGRCAADLADPANPLRACDFEVLWLHEVVGRIERWRGRRAPRPEEDSPAAFEDSAGLSLRGRIKNVIWDRGYGFIAADDGRDYFFHINALEPGLEFDELQPNLTVSFEVKSGPMRGRAGAARLVRRDLSVDDETPAPAEGAAADAEASMEPPGAGLSGEAAVSEPPLEDHELRPAQTDADSRS